MNLLAALGESDVSYKRILISKENVSNLNYYFDLKDILQWEDNDTVLGRL